MPSPSASSPTSPAAAGSGDLGQAVNLSIEIVAGNERLYLQGCIGVDNVSEYRDRVIDLLQEKPDLFELDLSRVGMDGSSMIALLIAIQRFVHSANRHVSFIDPQPKLLEMSEMTGLRDILSFVTH